MSAPGTETPSASRAQALWRVIDDCVCRREQGEDLSDAQVIAAHPELMPELQEELAGLHLIRRARVEVDADSALTSPSVSVGPAPGEPPQTRFPGYEIIREIHRGGQGVVYEAVQRSTKRTVAVKVLIGGGLADRRAQWRFEREVDLIAALRHPHIVVIHDSGVAEGNYFYAMDYVRGDPLDTHVRMAQPSIRQMVRIFRSVCDAVAHAHAHGIIHRDLKPSNILVGQDGHAYVVDFGLAKILSGEPPEKAELVSVAGNLMGTIAYMAPEQTKGDPDLIDTRTDVYALGVVLYRLVTGAHPYEVTGDLQRVFRTIQTVDPPRPSRLIRAINSELDAIILKTMEKEPARRYQSAAELTQDLDAWLDGRPIAAKSASSLYLIRKIAFRHGFETITIAALLIVVVSFSSIALYKHREAERARAGQTLSDQAFIAADRAREHLTSTEHQAQLNQFFLPWFLLEWHQGRREAARAVQRRMLAGSPEYLAAQFLLDGQRTLDQLLTALPADSGPLPYFVAGEREMRDGRMEAARSAYRRSLELIRRNGRDKWFELAATARLEQIALSPAAALSSQPAGTEGHDDAK